MLRKKRNSALKIAISLLLIISLTGCSISGKVVPPSKKV